MRASAAIEATLAIPPSRPTSTLPGTIQQSHFVAPNPWGIIGVFPIPHKHKRRLGLF
jgi:hypothetical protein